ncbi:uncharacterized protein LOC115080633 [Rhinatrema bivittatum]|uniref:uncharacterized protein LOC115080633 n=1 Tax=Rhinatrema bivittatum TaxID=194408 RepID=UPI00112EBDA6|nr:uncharacterized protein LOC115080633 [Rhinatrema bivittatum]
MAEQVCFPVSVKFNNVAAYFLKEDWDVLQDWQKELYRNVMKDIHAALISLGYVIVNPDILLRIKQEEKPYFRDPPDSEERGAFKSPTARQPAILPDVLLRIKQEDVSVHNQKALNGREGADFTIASSPTAGPDMRSRIKQEDSLRSQDHPDLEKKENPSTSYPIVIADEPFEIKQEEGPYSSDPRDPKGLGSGSSASTECLIFNRDISLWIKQVEDPYFIDHQDCEKKEGIISPHTARVDIRFPHASRCEAQKALAEKDAKNTKIVMKTAVSVFSDYLKARHLDYKITDQYDDYQLNSLLCEFYADVRKPNGDYYAKKSITTFRYGLQKFFHQQRGVDIVHDPVFRESNIMMSAVLTKLKREGKGDVQHKEPLTKDDFRKLYASCDIGTPAGLQHKVFVDLMLHLYNRGREKLREFCKDEFLILIDSAGHKYIATKTRRLPRNQRGEQMDSGEKGPRMYELKGNPRCPVLSFEKYIMKLHPENPAFWQRPKPSAPPTPSPWYGNAPIGKNALGNFMKTLSQDYGLSKIYTNHCLRATCVTAFERHGYAVAQHSRWL